MTIRRRNKYNRIEHLKARGFRIGILAQEALDDLDVQIAKIREKLNGDISPRRANKLNIQLAVLVAKRNSRNPHT